jgi:hypothetical protein
MSRVENRVKSAPFRRRWAARLLAASAGLAVTAGAGRALAAQEETEVGRNFAGSIQFDYLAVPTEDVARRQARDGATVELSLKLAVDFSSNVSANVKVCYGCHGVEVGMAFFDMRVADQLNFRVGRFTPAFGDFPLRHDPANHRTSDKPLPYDMGRMLRLNEWNMSVLPAPWVDNGIEISGTQFFGSRSQLDYALYAVSGAKGPSEGVDLDFLESRSSYIDNNSRPSLGGRLVSTLGLGAASAVSAGASGMAGTYDPQNRLRYAVLGGDFVLRLQGAFLRAEYLIRRTEMALGEDPATRFRYGPGANGEYANFFTKEGWYGELEVPVGRFDFVARWDGLRRRGNVVQSSPLRSNSVLLRWTAAATVRIGDTLRIKVSAEHYDFSDFEDEIAIHAGLAGPF